MKAIVAESLAWDSIVLPAGFQAAHVDGFSGDVQAHFATTNNNFDLQSYHAKIVQGRSRIDPNCQSCHMPNAPFCARSNPAIQDVAGGVLVLKQAVSMPHNLIHHVPV